MNTIKGYIFVIIILFFLIPVSIPLLKVGSKPVDIVFSDLLLLFIPFFIVLYNKLKISYSFKLLSIIIICNLIWGGFSSLLYFFKSYGEIVPIVSFINFYKAMLFFFIGYLLFSYNSFKLLFFKYIYIFISLIIIILFFSTLFNERFPVLLWGENFFSFKTYGFPNSFISFLSILSTFILYKYLIDSKKIYLLVYIIAFLIVVFSLSRSSFLVFLSSSLFLFLFLKGNSLKLLFQYISIIFIAIYVLFNILSHLNNSEFSKLITLVEHRIDRTMGNTEHDASSGRVDIWVKSLEIINEKPLVGFSFEPFSNHSLGVDTPHQQYLEIWYKTGIIGLLLFLLFFVFMLIFLKKLKNQIKYLYFSIFFGICLGSMTQPNFSFSLIGNFIFFMSGSLISLLFIEEKNNIISEERII